MLSNKLGFPGKLKIYRWSGLGVVFSLENIQWAFSCNSHIQTTASLTVSALQYYSLVSIQLLVYTIEDTASLTVSTLQYYTLVSSILSRAIRLQYSRYYTTLQYPFTLPQYPATDLLYQANTLILFSYDSHSVQLLPYSIQLLLLVLLVLLLIVNSIQLLLNIYFPIRSVHNISTVNPLWYIIKCTFRKQMQQYYYIYGLESGRGFLLLTEYGKGST